MIDADDGDVCCFDETRDVAVPPNVVVVFWFTPKPTLDDVCEEAPRSSTGRLCYVQRKAVPGNLFTAVGNVSHDLFLFPADDPSPRPGGGGALLRNGWLPFSMVCVTCTLLRGGDRFEFSICLLERPSGKKFRCLWLDLFLQFERVEQCTSPMISESTHPSGTRALLLGG